MKNRHTQKKTARWVSRHRRRLPVVSPIIYASYNFSEIEDDENAFGVIGKLASKAGKNAAAEAKAAGLSRTYIRNYRQLVQVTPSGEEISVQPRLVKSSFYVKYKPFTILHAVKK